jgi:hypothetical protein
MELVCTAFSSQNLGTFLPNLLPSIPFRQIGGTILQGREEKPVVSDLETLPHSRKCLTASQKGRRIISSFCSNTRTHPYHFIQGYRYLTDRHLTEQDLLLIVHELSTDSSSRHCTNCY